LAGAARGRAGQACSGFLVEHDGFGLLVDLGYATVPRLLERAAAEEIDAVFIRNGHPDHCADLSPLLRARVLSADPPAPLPVHALPAHWMRSWHWIAPRCWPAPSRCTSSALFAAWPPFSDRPFGHGTPMMGAFG